MSDADQHNADIDAVSRRGKPSEDTGHVVFPHDDPRYSNTGEGGLFVRLVVKEAKEYDERWVNCCGGTHQIQMDEILLGGSARDFPSQRRTGIDDHDRYLSVPCLATLTIGSTGWSGYHEAIGTYWMCHFEDLTEDGRALYNLIGKLYPGHKIELQTWLDT